jgi:drug/metabolite transporter (DMT)-like permease
MQAGPDRLKATLAGCAAILLWAFLALLTRAASVLPPLELSALAFTVSAIFGVGVVAARGQLHLLRLKPAAWAHGVIGLAGYQMLYFAAFGLAPAAQVNLINYCWPLLIVLFAAPVLGTRLGWRHFAGTLLGAGGCLLLLLGKQGGEAAGPLAWLGYALAFAAAVTWALYSVLSRRMEAVPTAAVAGFCAASAVVTAIAHFAFEPNIWPDHATLLAVVVMGLGPVGGAFFLWDVGMKRGNPVLLGTLAYATPVLSTLLLCVGGFAPFSVTLAVSAALVAIGGVVASRSP